MPYKDPEITRLRGREARGSFEHVDHIDAIKVGGISDCSNLTSSCGSCNSSKSTKPLLVWLSELRVEF